MKLNIFRGKLHQMFKGLETNVVWIILLEKDILMPSLNIISKEVRKHE